MFEKQPSFLDSSVFQDHIPWDSSQKNLEQAEICSPEGQGCNSALFYFPFPQSSELHHLIACVARLPATHISDKFILICKYVVQEGKFSYQLFDLL